MRIVTVIIVLLAATSALAQNVARPAAPAHHEAHDDDHPHAAVDDATVTLPDVYRVQFENDWVKVTRVHYAPLAKLPAHAHTSLASAYVYLNSSGPVMFRHVGGAYGTVTRAPTMRGGFRLFRGVPGEVHEVENLAPLPSDFLRIEFKTDPVDPRTLRGKFLPEPTFDEPLRTVQFENAQVRITRLFWPRGTSITVGGELPALFVSLAEGTMGEVRWLVPGTQERLENASLPAMDALLFELKSTPATR